MVIPIYVYFIYVLVHRPFKPFFKTLVGETAPPHKVYGLWTQLELICGGGGNYFYSILRDHFH